MKTVKYNESLSEDEKIKTLKNAKGGTWCEGWKPYCLNCSSNQRMLEKSYGFICVNCQNMIGWDLTQLEESPLNNKMNN